MNVVLIHGFGENSIIWDDFINHLDTSNKYFLFDFSEETQASSMADYAKLLDDFVVSNKLESFVLIGHSMGGYIALEYINIYKTNKVKGLGLFHSTAAADTDEKKIVRNKTIDFIEKNGSKIFIEGFYGGMFAPNFYDKILIDTNKAVFNKISKEALIAATKAMRDRNEYRELIIELKLPIFQIIGQLDTFVNPQEVLGQSMGLFKPGILLIPEVAHAGMYETPELCAIFINKFLKVC